MNPFSLAPFKTRAWSVFLAGAALAACLLHSWNATLVNDETKPPERSLEDDLRDLDTNGFKRAGPKGIRFLTHILEYKPLAEKTDAFVEKLPFHLNRWIAPPFSLEENWARRFNATEVLSALGPDAAPAVPSVLHVLQDPATDWGLKASCLEILGSIGPKSKPAAQTILAFTTNSNFAAQAAALALWKIDGNSNVVAEAISNRLRCAGFDRTTVLPYFQSMGPALVAAEPVLDQALLHEDENVRGQAEQILGALDPSGLRQIIDDSNRNAGDFLQSHIHALKSLNRMERINAMEAIAVYGPAAASAVPLLLSRLEKLDKTVQLNGLGPAAKDKYELDLCLNALAEIGAPAAAATPELLHLLQHTSPRRSFGLEVESNLELLCRVLGRIGPGAAEAVPTLTQLLTNNAAPIGNDSRRGRIINTHAPRSVMRDPVAAVAAFSALAQIAPNSREVQGAMRMFQTNNFGALTARAAVALWRLGLETNLPLSELTTNLDAALQPHIGRFGRSERGKWTLNGPNQWAYINPNELKANIELLGDIGPSARGVLAELEKCLGPTDPLRRKTAIAIRKIDPAEAQKLGLPGLLIVVPN